MSEYLFEHGPETLSSSTALLLSLLSVMSSSWAVPLTIYV